MTRHFAHSPRSRAHLTSSLHLSFSPLSARTTLGGTLLLLSLHLASWHERFSHAMLLGLHVYITCMLCISCFYYVYASLLYLYTSSRASCHHALTSYHTLHYCSVPVQRTSRQSQLCRCLATSAQHPLPVMSTLHLHYNSLVQDTRVNLRRTPESQRTHETACMMDIV